jgi:hypothetical protein
MIEYKNNEIVYWNYFIALEKDIDNITRYVEFNHDNEATYSIEFAKLLMAASSEVDVIMKDICTIYNMKNDCISNYRKCIQKNIPDMIEEEYFIERYSINCKPWGNWNQSVINKLTTHSEKFDRDKLNPDWWNSYNNVKHHRNTFFREANLINTLNAVGALLICNIYYLKSIYDMTIPQIIDGLKPKSALFTLNNKYYYEPVRDISS